MIRGDLKVGPYDESKKRQYDLINIKMKGGNFERFNTEFVNCLLRLPDEEMPKANSLEDLYSKQVETHAGFYQTYCLYRLGIDQQGEQRDCERLQNMVETYFARQQQDYNSRQFNNTSYWQGGGHAYPAPFGGPKGPAAGECPQVFTHESVLTQIVVVVFVTTKKDRV